MQLKIYYFVFYCFNTIDTFYFFFANSLTKTLTNLESSTQEFSIFTQKMNSSKGVLSKLVTDENLGKSVDSIIIDLKETVKAAQNNFLLKGYFNKKKKAEEKNKLKN